MSFMQVMKPHMKNSTVIVIKGIGEVDFLGRVLVSMFNECIWF